MKQLKVPEGLILSTDYVVHFMLEEIKDCDIFRLFLEVVKLVIDFYSNQANLLEEQHSKLPLKLSVCIYFYILS